MKVKINNKPITVTVNIEPGSLSLTARQQWHVFWSKLISQVNDKAKEERQQNQKPEGKKVTDDNS